MLLLRDGAGWLLPRIGFSSKHCYILAYIRFGPRSPEITLALLAWYLIPVGATTLRS